MEPITQFELALSCINLIKLFVSLNVLIAKNTQRIARRRRYVNLLSMRLRKRRKCTVDRTLWTLDRSGKFWEEEVPTYTDKSFKDNFRVNRAGFNKLVQSLPFLAAQDTNLRTSIPLEKRIAIALYALGSSGEYRTIANLFGVGRSTVGEIVRDFCEAVVHQLQNEYLSTYPMTRDKMWDIVNGFDEMGFPQCIGAIDGCHIEVCPPKEVATDYYNYKGWYSTVLLAICDHRCNFTYINVGSPGKNNDSYIFENAAVRREHATNEIYSENSRLLHGTEVPVLLIGDSAFQLSKFLMKPFPFRQNQSPVEKLFNYRLSKCRRVIENAFGRLKARYRRLLKGLEVNIDNVPLIIKACCILNNFCNQNNDDVPDLWMQNLENDHRQPIFVTVIGNKNTPAVNIRNAIAGHFRK